MCLPLIRKCPRRRAVLLVCLMLSLCVTRSTDADVVFPPHDFSDGTSGGWEGAGPTVEPNGGPLGEGDAFLKVIANETGRQGSRAAVYNVDPSWTGVVSSSVGFTFDMVNFTSSSGDLDMRLVLFGPSSVADRWTSTEPIVVPNDGVWQSYRFTLDESDFTRVNGNATFDEMIASVQRIMLRHDEDEPSAQGTPVLATIGLDNLALDLGPCFFGACDVNGDGICDVQDLDALMVAVASGENDAAKDFNADGMVDNLDRDVFLMKVSDQFGFSEPILLGDANLDGSVNATDLNAIAVHWQSDKAKWSEGNFSGANVDASDLNALALNWQKVVPKGAAATHTVPEPSSHWLAILAFLCVFRGLRWSPQ